MRKSKDIKEELLEKTLDKLPKTKVYLNKVVESTEEFQVRRRKKIMNRKLSNSKSIKGIVILQKHTKKQIYK